MERPTEEMTGSTTLPLQVIVVRLPGALVFCGMIGFERETRRRPAGLRTHMLGADHGTSRWLAAAIGLSAGVGMWPRAVATTLLAPIIIRLIKIAEDEASPAGEARERES